MGKLPCLKSAFASFIWPSRRSAITNETGKALLLQRQPLAGHEVWPYSSSWIWNPRLALRLPQLERRPARADSMAALAAAVGCQEVWNQVEANAATMQWNELVTQDQAHSTQPPAHVLATEPV